MSYFWKGNFAHCLTKLSVKSFEKLVFLDTTPPDLSSMLFDDVLSISFC